VFPGLLDRIRTWFRDYKIPEGFPPGEFGYNGAFQNKTVVERVINETNGYWLALKNGTRSNTEDKALY
jgi:inorganic pyrophosphatase